MSKPRPVLSSEVSAVDPQTLTHQDSQPSSKPPSRRPSAGALSTTSGERKDSASSGSLFHKRRGSEVSAMSRSESQAPGEEDRSFPSPPLPATSPGRFNLRDLIGAPRPSHKGSASSRKSDPGGKPPSTAGENDFFKKYGACSKLVIGKGASSVIRLAHKWDRTEEKVYAVKVLPRHLPSPVH